MTPKHTASVFTMLAWGLFVLGMLLPISPFMADLFVAFFGGAFVCGLVAFIRFLTARADFCSRTVALWSVGVMLACIFAVFGPLFRR